MKMSETNNIVIIGASYGGLGTAHYFLRHILPTLPAEKKYHVYLISPSTQFYNKVGSPRALASAELLPDSKMFLDIRSNFEQYGDKITFVQAKATGIDTDKRTVTYDIVPGGEEKPLSYHALVIASGAKSTSNAYALADGPHERIQAALADMHQRLKTAKSVIIAGGGPVGVESAGEIGELFNGAAGWFAKRPSKIKMAVTLLAGSDKLLPILPQAQAKQAEVYLNRVGVDVVYSDKVAKVTETGGKTQVFLESGKELECDIYIPAMGVTPMTSFVPDKLLENGFVKVDKNSLRVEAAGDRVYALGDCCTANRSILDVFETIPALLTNIKRDILLSDAPDNAKPTWGDRSWVPIKGPSQLVPVGHNKGVGAFKGNRLPSLMVWMIKGRDFMAGSAVETVQGGKWKKEVGWKPTDG